MDAGWDTGAAAPDAWSGGAAAGSDLGFGFTSAATGGETATPSSSGGYAGASGSGGGYTRGLNVKAQLSIERLPFETSIETIRNIFGRYGRVARVVCDYRIAEERLNVWLDYEDEKSCENAVRENGRKMERNTIVVQKSSSGEGGFGGSRGPKKDAWGNISRGPKGDRGESRGDTSSSGLATSSDTTATSGDWASADWGASTSTTDNNSGFDSSFDNEDRRSSRGRGGGRGGRDRGGRGGGRGRGGGGGGGRFQPYDKSDDYGEKSALPAWDDIVAGKSSTSTATPKADWGGSGDADSGNKDSVPFSQQPTQPLNIDWD